MLRVIHSVETDLGHNVINNNISVGLMGCYGCEITQNECAAGVGSNQSVKAGVCVPAEQLQLICVT